MFAAHVPPQPQQPPAARPAPSSWQPSPNHDQTLYARADDTLARISDYANDVEMLEPAYEGVVLYLVLDTNVLIDNTKAIRCFSEDVDNAGLPWPMKIIVPSVTLSELDGLKNSERVSWFARTASTMLLERVMEKKSLKVQARSETLGTKPKNYEHLQTADIAIWDCCQYFKSQGPNHQVVLLTNDRNLRILHENDEPVIPTLAPGKSAWSSRYLAKELFKGHIDDATLRRFRESDHTPRYRPTRSDRSKYLTETAPPRGDDDDDSMDIDDAASSVFESWVPSHALDALHIQVIDHFSIVLKQLANRVRHEAGDVGPPTQSRYAPGYRRKDFVVWNVRDCLEYLREQREKREKRKIKLGQPPLETFLLRRNEDRGWRRGQDWSRKDWENCVDQLTDIASAFEDALMLNSITDLSWQVQNVFDLPMRPTGI